MFLSTELTFYYCKMSQTSLGYVDLDAAACYDRIIRSVGILGFMKHGAPPGFAKWYLAMMDLIRHYLITLFGVDYSCFPPDDIKMKVMDRGLHQQVRDGKSSTV